MKASSIVRFVLLLGIFGFGPGLSPDAESCSRVLWSNKGRAVVVGRNMDWVRPVPVDLYAFPRGIRRDGMTGGNTLAWAAKYGTIVAEATDGMNEKGFSGHILWLAETDYGTFDPGRPGLCVGRWLQFYLDNFATVQEAVDFTEKTPFRIVTQAFDGRKVTSHLAIEDATGDSAVIEYLDGKPRVYHGRDYTVMTNSPPFDEQLKNLRQFRGFGGEKPLPGTTQASDRFVRGAFYLKNLPEPKDNKECIAGVLSVIHNVAQPFGTADPVRPNISATRWQTVCDLTNLVYYFGSATSLSTIWVKLGDLDFSEGAATLKLDLVSVPDRTGDCSKQFEPAEPFVVPPPDLK